MKAKLVGWAGLLAATTLAAYAQVYQQPPAATGSGFSSNAGMGNQVRIRYADNFRLDTAAVIRAIEWWGGSDGAGPDRFHVGLFADAAGAPGALLAQADAGDGSPRATGEWLNEPVQRFSYSATIPAVELPGQQQLWLVIENTTDERWLWEMAAPELPFGVLRSYDGGPWGDGYGNNASFALFAVPEPISAALIAFASVALFLRRRRD